MLFIPTNVNAGPHYLTKEVTYMFYTRVFSIKRESTYTNVDLKGVYYGPALDTSLFLLLSNIHVQYESITFPHTLLLQNHVLLLLKTCT